MVGASSNKKEPGGTNHRALLLRPNPLEYALIYTISFDEERAVVGNREECTIGISTSNTSTFMRIPCNVEAQTIGVLKLFVRNGTRRGPGKMTFFTREEEAKISGHGNAVG